MLYIVADYSSVIIRFLSKPKTTESHRHLSFFHNMYNNRSALRTHRQPQMRFRYFLKKTISN
jgi:hypothetical protein